MINFSENQLSGILQRDPERFLDSIIHHIIASNPEEVRGIPLNLLRDMVSVGVARAKQYHLIDDGDVISFVSIMFEIAPNFDEEPTLNAILLDSAVAPSQRWQALFETTPALDDAWERAAHPSAYEPAAWLKPQSRSSPD
jgi:hypothetical protein